MKLSLSEFHELARSLYGTPTTAQVCDDYLETDPCFTNVKEKGFFEVFKGVDSLDRFSKDDFIDVIWNDGGIGYNQSVKSLNFDNVVAFRVFD